MNSSSALYTANLSNRHPSGQSRNLRPNPRQRQPLTGRFNRQIPKNAKLNPTKCNGAPVTLVRQLKLLVTNSRDVMEAWRALGLECPEPVRMKALLDTGAAVTVISKAFARHCKLMQTGETEIRALGILHKCGEHAAAISFPGTSLRSIDPIRIVSAEFIKEPNYACLIGRDILRNLEDHL